MSGRNLDVGRQIDADGILTNYHDSGSGAPVLLIHGSGPGVTAWANWCLTLPALSENFRVLAPDIVGFGFSLVPDHHEYSMDRWIEHLVDFLDALDVSDCAVVGNSFGGALALALTIRHPERVNRLVLMGSAGVPFVLTEGLDKVWGYTLGLQNMRELLDIFVYDSYLITDELVEMRYRASARPGVQERFTAMFPAPRQFWVDAIASAETDIRAIRKPVLIIHGRDDRVIPLENAYKLLDWIRTSELHVFGRCGHWTQIEYAAGFNRLVSDFLLNGAR